MAILNYPLVGYSARKPKNAIIPNNYVLTLIKKGKNVDVIESKKFYIDRLNYKGSGIHIDYAFKEGHPLLKYGIGHITAIPQKDKKAVSLAAYDTKNDLLAVGFKQVKDLIARVKSGWDIKGMEANDVLKELWKHNPLRKR